MELSKSSPKPTITQRIGTWVMGCQSRVELDPREAGLRAMAIASLNIPNDVSSISERKT